MTENTFKRIFPADPTAAEDLEPREPGAAGSHRAFLGNIISPIGRELPPTRKTFPSFDSVSRILCYHQY